ncbi:TonB-dependent receptor [Pedobacter sp. P351]|uniref:TonB-dependent receptor n=1 Tax=Pedobacter superstes TaxID=3133441 RepID=UPI0030A83EF0
MNFTQAFLPALLLLFATVSSSHAQERTSDTLKSSYLDEVVVSATRNNVKRSKVPQTMTVISKSDIDLTPSADFTDLVKKNSSVSIIQYPGLSSGVGIRGFRPQFSGLNQRALLLIDGRPAGTANLSTINSTDVERIEILKGPASALYGSQAMGGVVNVITRKSSGMLRSNVFVEYGSYETFKAGGTSGGNVTDNLDFDLSFNLFDRNKNMKLGAGNFFRKLLDAKTAQKNYSDGTRAEEDDKRADGLRREFSRLTYNSANLRLGYKLTNNWRVDIKGERFAAKNVEAPSDIAFGNGEPSSKDINKSNGEASLSGKVSNHQLSLRGYLSKEDNLNNTLISSGAPIIPYLSFRSSTQWKGLQLKDVYQISKHAVIAGIDFNDASTKSRSFNPNNTEKAPFSPNYNLQSLGAYLQGQLNFLDEKLIVNPGARLDLITYNVKQTPFLTAYSPGKESNPFFSPSLAAQYTFIHSLTVHGTVGRAFVTPDAYNVAGYSENVNTTTQKANITVGNPNLKNENSTSWDAGLRVSKPSLGLSADITYFSTHVNDRITTERTTLTSGEKTESGYVINTRTTYVNANEANINGLEAEFAFDLGALKEMRYSLKAFGNATRTLKAEEVTITNPIDPATSQPARVKTYRDIFNVTNFTATCGLEYNNLKGLDLRLSGRYVGKRKDTDFNDTRVPQITYPSFMTIDFGAGYTFMKSHSISLLLNNMTDENYYEKRGYNLQGRSFSLRYSLNF